MVKVKPMNASCNTGMRESNSNSLLGGLFSQRFTDSALDQRRAGGISSSSKEPGSKRGKAGDKNDESLNLVMRRQSFRNRFWSADTTFRILYDRRHHPEKQPEQQVFPWTVQSGAGVGRDRIIARNWPEHEPRFVAVRTNNRVPTTYDVYSMSPYRENEDQRSSSNLVNTMHLWGTVTCYNEDQNAPVWISLDMVDGAKQYCVKLPQSSSSSILMGSEMESLPQHHSQMDSGFWNEYIVTCNGDPCARIRPSSKRHNSLIGVNIMASHESNSWELTLLTKAKRRKDHKSRMMKIHPAISLILTSILHERV